MCYWFQNCKENGWGIPVTGYNSYGMNYFFLFCTHLKLLWLDLDISKHKHQGSQGYRWFLCHFRYWDFLHVNSDLLNYFVFLCSVLLYFIGYAMAVTGNEAHNHIARFLTDFETGNANSGCLTFKYFIDGLTPASLACIKQGFVTQYVFATARKTQDHWGQAEVDVQFHGDKVMVRTETK